MFFYCVWKKHCRTSLDQWKYHLVRKCEKIICWWIKFSNSWHKQLFQMSQYLLENNTFSHTTTFVNETNTFYQHVDRSPRIWLWGPHKGSQAKLQYFSKRPLVFYSLSLFECFLKVFNLHPNAVPLFNLIYNADAEAIRVTEVHPQERHRRKINKIILLLYVSHMNWADKTFILYKKTFSFSDYIIKAYMW